MLGFSTKIDKNNFLSKILTNLSDPIELYP